MSKGTIMSTVGRLVLAAACVVSSASCGSELLRTGRAPVYLSIVDMEITNGATQARGANLRSDVITLVDQQIGGQTVKVPTIFNDVGVANIRVSRKDPSVAGTDINAVTITRYSVRFRRADGRNTPGVDVPYGFDGGASATIGANSEGAVAFELVRHAAKAEPPLRNLINLGGQMFIYTIAEITFYGRDQNGNEVTVTGNVDVAFSDFGDES